MTGGESKTVSITKLVVTERIIRRVHFEGHVAPPLSGIDIVITTHVVFTRRPHLPVRTIGQLIRLL